MAKRQVLYVEDELSLAMIVRETLENRGFEVHFASDGVQAIETFRQANPDICVLDIMLPELDGYSVAREIRKADPHIPVIFLTAKTQTKDVLEGFSAGGNDYLRKPFSMEELIVRIDNMIKITQGAEVEPETEQFTFGSFQFYPKTFELKEGHEVIQLSHREAKILEWLCRHMNNTCQRKDILMNLWGDDSYFNSRNLDVYINKLRNYFKQDERVQIITLKGVGYLFRVS